MFTPGSRGCAYKTASGRRNWLNHDPIGEAGGINLYECVANNPINFVDPYGLLGLADFNPALLFDSQAWNQLIADHPNPILYDVQYPDPSTLFPDPGAVEEDPYGYMLLGGAQGLLDDAGGSSLASTAKSCPKPTPKWLWPAGKGVPKMLRQMQQRGWTPQQITDAIQNGEQFAAQNLVSPGNPAIRYVNPTTGQSVVVDTVTHEVIHVGGPGFKY